MAELRPGGRPASWQCTDQLIDKSAALSREGSFPITRKASAANQRGWDVP